VKILVDRKAILEEILSIEVQIKSMRREPTYLKINRNLNHLEARRYGRNTVHVASPDNLEKTLELKNRSPEMRETISRYKEMQNNFEVQIDNLYVEKARLQDLLFARVHD
jgi:hypothetical protein